MTPNEMGKYPKWVEFTQYVRPNGQKRLMYGPVTEEVYGMAVRLLGKGYRFEIEVLRNDMVSMTITDGEQDVAIELVENGPPVLEATDRLIRGFHAKVFGVEEVRGTIQ